MKKLMIAMTLLAACSLTVQAETEIGRVNFEDREPGAFNVTDDTVEGGAGLWTRDPVSAEGDSEIVAETEPEANKFLKIDEASILMRKLDTAAVEIPDNGGISVASKVQFTAQDAEDPAPTLEEGAKLAIWMKKYDGEVPTNVLVVTAGKRDGNTVSRFDYEFKGDVLAKALEENVWYDVEIKAEMNADGLPGFKINFAGAELVNPDDGLFLSLDPLSETIASLGFKGTGAADDLVFSTYENEQPIKVAVTVTPEEADAHYQIDDGAIVDIDAAVGFTVLESAITGSVTITAEYEGYKDYTKVYTKEQFLALDGNLEIVMEAEKTPLQIFLAAIDDAEAGVQTEVALTDDLVLDRKVAITGDKKIVIVAEEAKTITGQLRVESGSSLTIGENVTVTSTGNPTVIVRGETAKATLVVNGTVLNTNEGLDQAYAICGSGNDATYGADITINGKVKNTNGVAIYVPQAGTFTVNDGALIEGITGAWVKSGAVVVTGGTLKGTYASATTPEVNDDGTTGGYGYGLIVETTTTAGGYADNVTIDIKGGSFEGPVAIYNFVRPETDPVAAGITGGTFSSEPAKALIVAGYEATEKDGVWTVAEKAEEPEAPIVVPEGETVEDVVTNATSEAVIVVNDPTQITIDNTEHTVQIGNQAPIKVADYYNVSIAGEEGAQTLKFELNENAKAEPATVQDAEGNEIPAVAVAENTVGVGVATKVGLWYGLETKASLDAETWTPPTSWIPGNGNGQALEAAKAGAQGFYRVVVSDIAPKNN